MRHPRVETAVEANEERHQLVEWAVKSLKRWGSVVAVLTGLVTIGGVLIDGAVNYSGKADKTTVDLLREKTVTKDDFTEFKLTTGKRFDSIDSSLNSIRTFQSDTRDHQVAFENFLKGQMSRNK